MDFRKVKISELKPAPWNPRTMSGDDMRKLTKSLHEFGFVDPVIVNEDFVVIGGNQRLVAAKALGMEEIPAVFVSFDDVHAKALNLALNSISADWNVPELKDRLEEIDVGVLPDIEVTGFSLEDCENLALQVHVEDKAPITCPQCGFIIPKQMRKKHGIH